jgi:hypothetical protein
MIRIGGSRSFLCHISPLVQLHHSSIGLDLRKSGSSVPRGLHFLSAGQSHGTLCDFDLFATPNQDVPCRCEKLSDERESGGKSQHQRVPFGQSQERQVLLLTRHIMNNASPFRSEAPLLDVNIV